MKIDQGLIARVIICGIALLNAVMDIFGLPHLELGNELITNFVNSGFLIIAALWGFWKNNNITKDAQVAQIVLNELKDVDWNEMDIETYIDTQSADDLNLDLTESSELVNSYIVLKMINND